MHNQNKNLRIVYNSQIFLIYHRWTYFSSNWLNNKLGSMTTRLKTKLYITYTYHHPLPPTFPSKVLLRHFFKYSTNYTRSTLNTLSKTNTIRNMHNSIKTFSHHLFSCYKTVSKNFQHIPHFSTRVLTTAERILTRKIGNTCVSLNDCLTAFSSR